MNPEDKISKFREIHDSLRAEIGKVIVGQNAIVEGTVNALFANGHVLLEGVPGLGKTLLVRTLSQVLDLSFNRIQFTPDLMPADVIGTNMVHETSDGKRAFEFQHGPIFSHLILADEINRATPKTQSAMLEAMQERSVTAGGEIRKLDSPFFVLATQNPIDQEGTYPLPEAQVDRFMLKTVIDYPKLDEEQLIVRNNLNSNIAKVKPVVTTKQIISAQETIREVYMDEKIETYILNLVFATRYPENYNLESIKPLISFGASPRGSINLATAAKCHAFLRHRGYVIPEDVRAVIFDVLRHRIGLTYEAEAENITSEGLITQIINEVEVP